VTGLLPTLFAATEENATETGGISALGLDPLAVVAQAVTFLLLFWVVKKFALDKIVASLEERRKTIDQGVRLGLEMQTEKANLDSQVEATLQKARANADVVLADAQREAGTIIKQAEESARLRTDTMLLDAQAHIDDEVTKAKRGLESEMVRLVAEATEIIISEKLDAKKDQSLIERVLAGVKHE
jgi:F-type H+-transporting ATPase subunit b